MIIETMTQKEMGYYIVNHRIWQRITAILEHNATFRHEVTSLKPGKVKIKKVEYDGNIYYYAVKAQGKLPEVHLYFKVYQKNHYEYFRVSLNILNSVKDRRNCVWRISKHFIQRYCERSESEKITEETMLQFLKKFTMDTCDIGIGFPETLDEEIGELRDTDSIFLATRSGIIRCICNPSENTYVTYYKENSSELFTEVREFYNTYLDEIGRGKIDTYNPTNSVFFIDRKSETPRTIYAIDGTGKLIATSETGREKNLWPDDDTIDFSTAVDILECEKEKA